MLVDEIGVEVAAGRRGLGLGRLTLNVELVQFITCEQCSCANGLFSTVNMYLSR